ncbi:ParB/RepB/Spo0J family partition protein [bacterium]|nr:ParB/RepB/Spo0J family partition protein [bacterium]MCK4325248.1 ParB/RepB/Spo0J family partition protein [bacterium]MCK4436344.1 ParB/RepB/Spo0J family partition protein [bacterium]
MDTSTSADKRKRVLGKGLEALIPEVKTEEREVVELNLNEVRPNRYQPRQDFSSLAELVSSIREKGVVQPILVRASEDGYELIAGERRWRAAKEVGLTTIPAIVKEMPEGEMLEVSLVENIQREDLNPLEEARAMRFLMDEFNLTQEALAQRLGKERPTVANTLRLLKLPKEVQEDVSRGRISAGHARALLALPSQGEQKKLSGRIIRQGLSVRETERLVERMKGGKKASSVPSRDPQIVAVEAELRRRFGTKVEVKSRNGAGRIIIEYYSHEDLGRIVEKLGV